MLAWRILGAVAIIVPLAALVAADFWLHAGRPGVWLLPVLLLCALAAAQETAALLQGGIVRVSTRVVLAGVAGVILAASLPLLWSVYPADCPLGRLGWPLAALAAALFACMAIEMARFREPGEAVTRLSLTFFAIAYVAVPLAFFPALRLLHGNAWGMAACVSVFLIAKSADIGAFVVGKNWGRTKLSPRLSPGKTWEGAIGGMLAAALVSWGFFGWVVPWSTGEPPVAGIAWRAALYGFILAAVGLVGDLGESLLKREFGRKDSSRWLPGLGGVLDLLDSILPAVPVAYICWAAGLLGPAGGGG